MQGDPGAEERAPPTPALPSVLKVRFLVCEKINLMIGIDLKDAKHSGWEGAQEGLLSWADQSRADGHTHPYEEQQ